MDTFIHLDTITDFICRKCTVMYASQDLARKIEHGKRVLAEKARVEQEEARQESLDPSLDTTTNTTTMLTNGSVVDNGHDTADSTLSGAADTRPQLGKTRRRSSKGVIRSSSSSSSSSTTSATGTTRISLEEMEKLKERIDYCLAHNVETDLVSSVAVRVPVGIVVVVVMSNTGITMAFCFIQAPLELTPIRSKRTTKHSMIAKPPQALCLHLNRSMFTDCGQMAKNPCRVQFGPRLDFTRFTTSGHLTTVATKTMSRRGSAASLNHHGIQANSSRPGLGFGSCSTLGSGIGFDLGLGVPSSGTPSIFARRASFGNGHGALFPFPLNDHTNTNTNNININNKGDDGEGDSNCEDRVVYRLWSVIVHLGSHNSGHFVTYRRIPTCNSDGLNDPSLNFDTHRHHHSSGSGSGWKASSTAAASMDDLESKWWRISDETVQIVDWHEVKNAEAYMLFFEKEETLSSPPSS
jgi:hypothetical protein